MGGWRTPHLAEGTSGSTSTVSRRMLDLAGLVVFDVPSPTHWLEPDCPLTGTIELSPAGRWWLKQTRLMPPTRFKFRPLPRRSATAHELHVKLDGSRP